MSTDIRAFVEIVSEPACWTSPGPDASLVLGSEEPLALDIHRDGDLFALLGHADASSAVVSDFEPIAYSRGLPGDISEATGEALRSYQGVDSSWLTLAELYDFHWGMPWGKSLWVSPGSDRNAPDDYAAHLEDVANSRPEDLMAEIKATDGDWRDGERTIASLGASAHGRGWRHITWYQPAISLLTPSWAHALIELGSLAHLHGRTPEQIRIVFTFA